MPQCALLKKKPQYDFKKEYLEASLGQGVEGEKMRSEGGDGPASLTVGSIKSTTDPCVEDIFEKDDLKKMFSKWNKLKRVRDMYDEQVSMKRADCFRYKILKHMKKKIVAMPPDQRRTWLTKLIKLAFMNRLKEIKDLKVKRKTALMDRLESARGEERDFLLRQLTQLKDIYDIKELDDVNQIIELKEAKKNDKLKKSKEIGMKIRLNRLKKLEEIKLNEEKRLREERVDKLKEIVSVKKHWQEDMIKKIDNVTKNLVEGLVHLKDKEEWYNKLKLEMEEEKKKLIEDENERLEQERIAITIQKDWEMAKKKREQKLKEIETWHKERKVRLWKLDRVKKFEDFLENRYKMAEANENLFFKKIFKKLSASEKRKVPVNPWAMKPILEDRQKEIAKRKKYNSWVNSIITSNKSRVVKNVKLKKYLEVMETPHFDKMFEAANKIDSVQHIMTIIRGSKYSQLSTQSPSI